MASSLFAAARAPALVTRPSAPATDAPAASAVPLRVPAARRGVQVRREKEKRIGSKGARGGKRMLLSPYSFDLVSLTLSSARFQTGQGPQAPPVRQGERAGSSQAAARSSRGHPGPLARGRQGNACVRRLVVQRQIARCREEDAHQGHGARRHVLLDPVQLHDPPRHQGESLLLVGGGELELEKEREKERFFFVHRGMWMMRRRRESASLYAAVETTRLDKECDVLCLARAPFLFALLSLFCSKACIVLLSIDSSTIEIKGGLGSCKERHMADECLRQEERTQERTNAIRLPSVMLALLSFSFFFARLHLPLPFCPPSPPNPPRLRYREPILGLVRRRRQEKGRKRRCGGSREQV